MLPWHDSLDAEVVIASGFAGGRLSMCLAREDLDSWAHALDALAAGRDVGWMDDGRNPEVRIEVRGQHGVPVVTVEDTPASGTLVSVPVRVTAGWVDEQRDRLRQVRENWPSEVIETAPNAYEWRR